MLKAIIVNRATLEKHDSFVYNEQHELDQWMKKWKDHPHIFGTFESSFKQELVSEEIPEVKEIQLVDGIETEVIIQEYQPAVYQDVEVLSPFYLEIEDISNELERSNKLQQIAELEAQITPRRYREAILSGDHSFIEDIELQIQAIRDTL